MKQFEKPIVEVTGGIHIGKNFMMSFQASWPFGKIEIYQDNIILKIQYIPNFILRFFQLISKLIGACKNIPREIELAYTDIRGYRKNMLGGITIIHVNDQYAPFLQIWVSKNKAEKIISHFNSKGIYKQK